METMMRPPVPTLAKPRWWPLIVGLSVVLSGGAFLTRGAHHETIVLQGLPAEVVVESNGVSVEVRRGGGTDVTITNFGRWSLLGPDIEMDFPNGTARLRAHCPGVELLCELHHVVTVPDGVRVRVIADATEVMVGGSGGELEVTTQSGDVHLTGDVGMAIVRTGEGDVSAADLVASSLRIDTTTGGVGVGLASVVHHLSLATADGDIAATVPGQPYALDARSKTGNVDTDIANDPSAIDSISAISQSGDVTVRLR